MNTQSVNHHKLINNIKQSQKKEMQLILDLEKLPNDNDSQESQKRLIEQMVKNANLRMNEFRQLQALYNVLLKTDQNSAAEIKDQMSQLEMVNKKLEDDKNKMATNKNINIGNLRMSQISTYYSDKYRTQAGVVIYVIYLCVPLLLLAILRNRGIISPNIMSGLVTIIIVIGLFLIVPKILDIRARNNMVFSEYDFSRNMKDDNSGGDDKIFEVSGNLLNLECIGPACCTAGMIYDNKREVCVVKGKTTESFLSGQSTSQNSQLIGSKV